jgi:hypothetical protein
MDMYEMRCDIGKFLPGQIVRIKTRGLRYTSDGFSTGGQTNAADDLVLFEMIDLTTFPSFNDFFGETTVVSHGDLVTIISYIGRPRQISGDTPWFKYDIYEILVNNQVRQIFSQNMETIIEERIFEVQKDI